jgi:hypothetical protein
MTTLTLHLPNQPLITLPAELASVLGLREGAVQVIPGQNSLTFLPVIQPADYTARWATISATLHEQTQQLDLAAEDHRDAEYWAIVAPLLEEAQHIPSTV